VARDQGQAAGDRARRRIGTVIGSFGLAICVILGLGLLGLPIGYSMIAGSILYLLLAGLDLGTSAEQILNGLYNSYVLLAVPLFLFSAELMNVSKMTDHLLRFCDMLVGRFRGGLGHINIAQSIIFAGMSGSAIADLAGTGRISIDMMTRNNRYPLSYAAAVTAASAVIGPIIPPSIPMVLYALVSDTSVGYLFLGGVIPGLLMALAQMAMNSYMAHKHDYPVEKPIPLREWPMITWVAMPALLMPVILLGGIYGGVMTPTEAAAVAAAYAFLVAVLWYRNITVRDTYLAVLNSSRATASIGMLIAGALIFNYVVTIEQIPNTVRGLLAGYELSPLMFLVVVNIILLVLGCLLEGSTIILVILPIFIPTAKALGIDLVHFGVVAVVNIMIGLITPPYGLLLFIISAISGAPLRVIIRDTMPFVWAMLVALAIITFVPDTVLWLPRLMGYKG
jgi:C4-dicarboxylate transporter DctM subunit